MHTKSFIVFTVFIVGCTSGVTETVTPAETVKPDASVGGSGGSDGGNGGSTHEGGSAGSHAGGSGGSAGSTATGGSGGSSSGGTSQGGSDGGNGGSGGAPPVNPCQDMLANHFALVVCKNNQADWPLGCLAGDCGKNFADGNGQPDLGWGQCFIKKVEAACVTVDYGDVDAPFWTLVNIGMSTDCSPEGNIHAVDDGAWLCAAGKCSVDITACWGAKQVGSIKGGAADGVCKFEVNNGANFECELK